MRSPGVRHPRAIRRRAAATARPAHGFLYARVAGELRQRIREAVYPPGARIPSEADLVREFGVSAITVRRAIRELVFEGLLTGRQGLGVFVGDTRRIVRVLGGDPRLSLGDEIQRAGLEPGLKELSFAPVSDPAIATRLSLGRSASVYRHEKLVLADGQPVSIDVVYLPRRLGETLRDELRHDFVFPLLHRHGVDVARTHLQFEAGAVSEDDAALLGLPVRSPLILVHYTLFGRGEAPILTGVTIARSDRFIFDVTAGTRAGTRTPRGPVALDSARRRRYPSTPHV